MINSVENEGSSSVQLKPFFFFDGWTGVSEVYQQATNQRCACASWEM